MAKFLVSVTYTESGAKGLRKDGGTAREHVVRLAIEGLGGKLEALYFALGQDDVIVIADLPDAVSAAALSLASPPTAFTAASTQKESVPMKIGRLGAWARSRIFGS